MKTVRTKDITSPTKVRIVKAIVFPVIMWKLYNKKRQSAKELILSSCGARQDLRIPLDCNEIKTVNLKGKDWCWSSKIWPPDVKSQLTGKDSDAGKIDGRRRRGWQRIRCLDGNTNSMVMNLGKLWEMVKDREAWHAAVHGFVKCQTQLVDWTTKNEGIIYCIN